MPARAARIYLFPAGKDQPGRVVSFPVWWDRSGFFNKYRDRQIDTKDPIYVDYAYLLTPGEALAWDEQCRGKSPSGVWSQGRNLESEMQQLEAALKESRWVIVESYEWESGLE